MAMNPRQAEKNSREPVDETFRSGMETGYETTRRTAEQTAQTMTDAGRQATTATADAIRQNAERTSEAWQSGSAIGGRMVERSMEQFSRLFGLSGGNTQDTMQRCFHNLQAITESGTNIADGLRNASAEWMAFAQDSVERNLDRMNGLMGCRSIDEYVAAQSELARDNLKGFLQSTRRMSEISAHATEEAVRRISQASSASKNPG